MFQHIADLSAATPNHQVPAANVQQAINATREPNIQIYKSSSGLRGSDADTGGLQVGGRSPICSPFSQKWQYKLSGKINLTTLESDLILKW